MLVENGARFVVRIAEKAAEYAAGKISVWYHYQPKEPQVLIEKAKENKER